MEILTFIVLAIVLVYLLQVRNLLKDKMLEVDIKLRSIKFELENIHNQLGKQTPTAESKASAPLHPVETSVPEQQTTPIESRPSQTDSYWESNFKVVGQSYLVEEAATNDDTSTTVTNPEEEIMGSHIPFSNEPIAPIEKQRFFDKYPDIEKFIGENLISKIGIGILVLAIGYFVKFAIDNNWIGPVGRVTTGILCGVILSVLAHKLRKNYQAFSSVLVGGGLAIYYFTITLAYQQFGLLSQSVAFVIMVLITVFAVTISLLYNRQELAVIALLGGFCAPFLVSNGSGNYVVLFSYLLILNIGLLLIAYNRLWRILNILAFIFTVILFAGWLLQLPYNSPSHMYQGGLVFATAFYVLFFVINMSYHIVKKVNFIKSDFSILLANTALYFGTGMYFLDILQATHYNGLFCIAMSVFHLGIAYYLFKSQKAATSILYLFIGLTLTFISLIAPLQLNGHYITLFWATEMVLLYWLSQKSGIKLFKKVAVIVAGCMLISLLLDWQHTYDFIETPQKILLNKAFITGIYTSVMAFIGIVLFRKYEAEQKLTVTFLGVLAIVLLYLVGFLEINFQFKHYYPQTDVYTIYLLLYSAIYVLIVVKTVNLWNVSANFFSIQIVLSVLMLFIFIGFGKTNYQLLLSSWEGKFDAKHLLAHWCTTIIAGYWIVYCIQLFQKNKLSSAINTSITSWSGCLYITLFLSIEMHLLFTQVFHSNFESLTLQNRVFNKAILPIIWGLISFASMWLGMQRKYKPLRIFSLTLFSLTLLKLFIFDIQNIPATGKIAAFFCLGVLLLVVSFMYQRVKNLLINDKEHDKTA